mmetsp:Transcript_46124/g.128276  ORF Transcript_46124/g.128276 Transcript_46124/m.128276 type:complete len:206 (-) Transcript_46124:1165-1782(-)
MAYASRPLGQRASHRRPLCQPPCCQSGPLWRGPAAPCAWPVLTCQSARLHAAAQEAASVHEGADCRPRTNAQCAGRNTSRQAQTRTAPRALCGTASRRRTRASTLDCEGHAGRGFSSCPCLHCRQRKCAGRRRSRDQRKTASQIYRSCRSFATKESNHEVRLYLELSSCGTLRRTSPRKTQADPQRHARQACHRKSRRSQWVSAA